MTEEEEEEEEEEGEEGKRRMRKHLHVISVTVFVRLCPFMSVSVRFCSFLRRRRRMRVGRRRTENVLYMRGLRRKRMSRRTGEEEVE